MDTVPVLAPGGFCTACGRPLVDGRCPGHAPVPRAAGQPTVPPVEAHGRMGPRSWSRWRVSAVVLGALLLLSPSLVLAVQVHALHDDVDGLRSQQADAKAAADRQVSALQSRNDDQARTLTEQGQAMNGLSRRLSTIESKVDSQPDPAAIAKTVAPSVFEVSTGDAIGTAWVIHSSGGRSTLITNYHVIASLYERGGRSVNLVRDSATFPADITAADTSDDLAVITARETFPALGVAKDPPAVGDPVLVTGSALGLEGTVTIGIVSALRDLDGRQYVQFSAPVSPGNSGGPVVDRNGRVVGVTEAKVEVQGAEGLGFAIPVAVVCRTVTTC